ncbi:hypothetical protein U9M48_041007, partial [Paspalum notatum var. saurae]
MTPDLKYLLDEMTKRFDDQDVLLVQRLAEHDTNLEKRLVDCDGILDQRLSDLDSKWAHRFQTFSADTEGRVSNIEAAAASIEEWRQEVEASVDDMHLEVKKLSKHWDRAVMDQPASDYFLLYEVEEAIWVRVASMHMQGAAARWSQSLDSRLRNCSWSEFCRLILDLFGKDQQELLIRQLINIRQTSTVAEYIERYAALVDQLTAYGGTNDPVYFTMRFIEGLSAHIKPAVMLQRPLSWDTAGLLAQLQEEMSEEDKRRDIRRPEFTPVKSTSKPAYPLPPPPRLDKFRPTPVDDRRSVDTKTPSADDRWTALKNYRRARGLCQRCAEKWSRDHKCADAVQLHAVQEVLELFSISDESDPPSLASTDGSEQLFLAISAAAYSGSSSACSVSLWGTLYDIPVHILIDSGSSHTFISTKIASQLSPMIVSAPEMKVQVASGHNLLCSSLIPAACWQVQTCSFIQDLRILDLSGYDMIVGLDWLEQFSPMEVHWKQKWLRIPYQGKLVRLCGLLPAIPEGSLLQIQVISASSSTSQSTVISPQVQALLDEYQHLFELTVDLPPTRECDHSIPLLPGASPVSVRPYRFPPALKDEIEKQVHEMLSNGLIQKSTSPFSSSVLLVKKKDNSWRFCVDYRQLNAITVKSKYPVPIIEELLDELHGSSWFSKLDLRSGFHQIRMSPGEEYKTAFQTHIGQFEFRVMTFGLTGAPGTFQSAMNSTLAPFLRKFVLVFFDDILIYSKTFADHLNHLELVFQALTQDSWQIKLSKCEFAQRQIHYLGHVISQDGVSTDPAKIEAIISWPSPSSVKELRSFLGLAGYYRRFVRHFGVFSRPLTALLKKHALFIWTTEHDASFAALKQALCKAPVLALPDFTQPFLLETDASGSDVGAVLMQGGHPLAYVSKALGPKSQGLSTYEKEYLAILMAVQHWRQYLGHTEFIISTDQKSLLQLSEQRLHTHWQKKVFSKLLGLNYKIVYKQGTENRAADALSRKPSHTASCAAITTVSPHWLDEVLQGYTADTHAQDLIAKLLLDPTAVPSFSLSAGLLRYKGRIWIGNNPSLQTRLLQACHDSAVGGHSGFPVTYSRIKQLFAWQGLKKAVRAYVQSCLICQKAKPDRARLPGLLQPLPVPDTAWQVISMDFVEGLPLSGRADCILVVVDFFTKYAHFVPLHHPFTAPSVAQKFLHHVYRLHGLPATIVTDRDKIFTSHFWRELFRLAGVTLNMTSSYHPQSDGQTERLNQTMETYLRCFVNACPSKWINWLSQAEYWYNTSPHSAIGRSPFEALYGYKPRHFGISETDAVTAPDVQSWLQDRSVMTDLIRQHLVRSRHRMKKQADKQRSDRQYKVGDSVLVKVQPYVQTSLARRSNQKLAFKYFGPYEVLACIGTAAYRLKLPSHTTIHPVFHVSQLKPFVSSSSKVLPHLPDDLSLPRVPVRVLQTRAIKKRGAVTDQVLVQWSGWPSELATWEDLISLKQTFPFAPAWGQAATQGGGNVSSQDDQGVQVDEDTRKEDEASVRPRRSRRARVPSSLVTGPQWAVKVLAGTESGHSP